MKKTIASILFIAGLATLISAINLTLKINENWDTSSSQQSPFAQKINSHLRTLHESNRLPVEWTQLAEIKFNSMSKKLTQLENQIRPNMRLNESGTHRLECTLFEESQSDPLSRVMIKYEIFDIKSDNKTWELIGIY
jgi:hypothetical protein